MLLMEKSTISMAIFDGLYGISSVIFDLLWEFNSVL